jgi:hypothetical protein
MSALDGLTGTSSFGTCSFWMTQVSPGAVPGRGRKANYLSEPIPYSDSVTLQLGGRNRPPLQLAVVLKTDDWAALDALVGTTATLDTATGLVATTALVDTGQPQFHGDGFVRTTLTFEFA